MTSRPDIYIKSTSNSRMENAPNDPNRKRGIKHLLAAELSWKLKSKADFIQYLDKHRKYSPP